MDIYHRSIQVILQNQANSGAYIASPNFPSYAYCWFRDGSFIAHAMDLVGEHASAHAFFQWGSETIQRYAWKVNAALDKLEKGLLLKENDFLHTRYTLEGKEARSQWWNFQLDGYGTWLWALAEHVAKTGDAMFLNEVATNVQTLVRYLSALWRFPNYDCWEEYSQYLHPYTLAAVYAGLKAAHSMGIEGPQATVAEEIRNFLLTSGLHEGHLSKYIIPQTGQSDVPYSPSIIDASLIGVAVPYHLLSPDDPTMKTTIRRIEADLHCSGGGVHRYLADTYYGGGEWVLLSAWLGWYYAEMGERAQARELLHWVEAQANARGHLPEQVSTHLLAPDCYAEWEARWGPVASPLLWSHAMYLILCHALNSAER